MFQCHRTSCPNSKVSCPVIAHIMGCKPVATLMESSKPEAAPEGFEASKEQPAVGCLMYAMLGT